MPAQEKTREELLAEIAALRRKVTELQRLLAERQRSADVLPEAERALPASDEIYRLAFESASDGIFTLDTAFRISSITPSVKRQLGYRAEELLGRPLHELNLLTPESLARAVTDAGQVLAGQEVTAAVYEFVAKDGTRKFGEVTGTPILRDGRILGVAAIVRDITARRRMEEEIKEMSLRDGLTELYNRRGFMTLAEQQIKAANREKRRLDLTFIDVDRMKAINDALGHEEGDRALIDAADMLRQTFRESDILARVGGDEFAVLSPGTTDRTPGTFPERLAQNMARFNACRARPYLLDMSLGTAVYDPESPVSLDRLMSFADERMYAQKKTKAKTR